MSMYPNISGDDASAPSAPGFNYGYEDKSAYQQPAYAPSYQPQPPPPPYSGPPNYGGMAPYQPPPPQPQPQPQQPSVVVTQPTTNVNIVMDKFPSKSIQMKCFFCQADIKTKIQPRSNICTWLLCSLLCFVGCFCGCCLIPFCTNGSRDILHYCPKCHKYLGSHERFRFR